MGQRNGRNGLRVVTDIDAEPEPTRSALRNMVSRIDIRPDAAAPNRASATGG